MLAKKSNRNLFKLASIAILSSVLNLGIAFSSNSQTTNWAEGFCEARPGKPVTECNDGGLGSTIPGNRVLEILEINGNGGNVYVRVYDANTDKTLLEANPGVGGRETFYFNGQGNYRVYVRLHNQGSSVKYRIGI